MCDILISDSKISDFISQGLSSSKTEKIGIVLVGGPGSGKSIGKIKAIESLAKFPKDFVNIDPDELLTSFLLSIIAICLFGLLALYIFLMKSRVVGIIFIMFDIGLCFYTYITIRKRIRLQRQQDRAQEEVLTIETHDIPVAPLVDNDDDIEKLPSYNTVIQETEPPTYNEAITAKI